MYDPVLGRFLSCDNYVQEPDNSQNFNRYSYCLNNPLRYTDPSGELFGIDDAVWIFAAFSAASSAMQAAATGQSVWKAVGISLLSSAASYGIGQAFGSLGGFWNEAARAGAHGLASGLTTSLSGGKFFNGFASGVVSSGMGSFAQSGMMSTGAMIGCCTVMGGLTSWATGGNFWDGAQSGLMIGALNHGLHGDEHQTVIRDGSKVGYQILLDDVVVTKYKVSWSTGIGMFGTAVGSWFKSWDKLNNKWRSKWVWDDKQAIKKATGYKIKTKTSTIYNKITAISPKAQNCAKGLGYATAAYDVYDTTSKIIDKRSIGLGDAIQYSITGASLVPGYGTIISLGYMGADYIYTTCSGQSIQNALNNELTIYSWKKQ